MSEADAVCTDQPVQIVVGGTSGSEFPHHDLTRNQPPEILGEIFSLVALEWSRNNEVELRGGEYPWILGHVCARWRQILWNSPIWNKIVANCSDLGRYYSTTAVDGDGGYGFHNVRMPLKRAIRGMLAYILERVSSPLSLEIWGSVEHVSDIIFAHANRFSTLILARVSQDTLFHLLALPPNTFTALQEISLTFTSINQPIPDYAISPFSTAPKLRKVMYRTEEYIFIPSLFLFPYSRLEEIRIETIEIPLPTIHNIWRFSPCLTSCAFRLKNIDDASNLSHLTIPSLKSLELAAFFDIDWGVMLRLITVPCMDCLSIVTWQISILPVISLISRSDCSLKVLKINEPYADGDDIDNPTIHTLFRLLQDTTNFEVSWALPTSAIHSIDDGALPRLSVARFLMKPEAFDVFLNMVDLYLDQPSSRSHRFKYFTVHCQDGPGFTAVHKRYQKHYRKYRESERLSICAISGRNSNLLECEYGSDEEELGYNGDRLPWRHDA